MDPLAIIIRGARQHNLKNISLSIPRNQLVVITGLSGSGKSSLAFDTLFAEGQRRYMESLSTYARQFLDQMQKPEVDHIEGLSPAIAIEQRTAATNPRSTIATTTEIFDFLRLLFASLGKPHHPKTGHPLKRFTRQEIANEILTLKGRVMILAPLFRQQKGEFRDVLGKLRKEGFIRARIDGQILEIEKLLKLEKNKAHTIEVVIDRLQITENLGNRLMDSIETALEKGEGLLTILWQSKEEAWQERTYSTHYFDPVSGETFEKLTPRHFSFNSPLGACPRCHGLGTLPVLDEKLVIRDPSLSLEKGVIAPWRHGHRRLQIYYKSLLRAVARHYPMPMDEPWEKLKPQFQKVILYGSGNEVISFSHTKNGKTTFIKKSFEGVIPQLERLHSETESQFTRNKIERYMSRQLCPNCQGTRFKPEILAVTLGGPYVMKSDNEKSTPVSSGKNIHEICELTIQKVKIFLSELQTKLSATEQKISQEVFREILKRLQFLEDVGLSYLTLNRESGTLSGGEAQRIRLATQIGSGLTSVLYILDEPSIGLHQSDNDRLLHTLKKLRDLGNSVIVVEHDEDTIRAADYVIDLGPGAGIRGGYLVAQGAPEAILKESHSLTGQFLRKERAIVIPRSRQKGNGFNLSIEGARANNLKNINVRFPLNTLSCVTGVSGSGKSSLINDILSRALFRHFYGSQEVPGDHKIIRGIEELDKVIEIDQSALGRTSRSNPVTYIGAFNEIRALFAALPLSRVRGYGVGRFSFNVKGGRCETCQGGGTITIPMHFLPDVHVVCEICQGKRFNRETLEITYRGKSISDVLDMSVDEAYDFFRHIPKIKDKLESLIQVGVGYLKLGQSADTLSGGEAQRVKLSAELAKKQTGRTLYLLDEPTTGLHFADVELLINVLLKLRNAGNTLIVIEHNLDVIKCADYLVDLGPGGGEQGGYVVATGTPEEVANNPKSITGRYLAKILKETF